MKLRIILITIVAMSFFGVMAFAGLDPDDNPGDVIVNPWAHLFTTAAPTVAPTETPTAEPTTEEPTTVEPTTVEPTTEEPTTIEPTTEPSGYDMHQLDYDTWENLGGPFYAYTGSGNGAVVEAGYNPDSNTAKTSQVSGGQWWTWGTQVAAVYPDLTADVQAGKQYHISWHIATEDGAYGNVVTTTDSGETQIDFGSGDITVEGTLVYNEYIGEAAWCIGTMWIPEGVSVIFDDPVITSEEPTTVEPTTVEPTTVEPTTVEPTTEEPTTVEPTTEEPTTEEPTTVEPTTVEPTTVEPTTEQPTTEVPTETTTVAPTTVVPTSQQPTVKPSETTVLPTPVPVIKVPEKAKITKIYKKKKSAKKIKIKIKKMTGATGYQVAIYKSKKNAKKNKKALVKKYVKFKKKITIKSKKLKNKKKLFIKARAYVLDGTTKLFGPWSKIKKAKIKK